MRLLDVSFLPDETVVWGLKVWGLKGDYHEKFNAEGFL